MVGVGTIYRVGVGATGLGQLVTVAARRRRPSAFARQNKQGARTAADIAQAAASLEWELRR
jgi:hypothetical protein